MLRRQTIQTTVEPGHLDQSQALRSLMGSAKQLTSEEQHKRKMRMKKIAQQQGEKQLDTFLSEELGLDF